MKCTFSILKGHFRHFYMKKIPWKLLLQKGYHTNFQSPPYVLSISSNHPLSLKLVPKSGLAHGLSVSSTFATGFSFHALCAVVRKIGLLTQLLLSARAFFILSLLVQGNFVTFRFPSVHFLTTLVIKPSNKSKLTYH